MVWINSAYKIDGKIQNAGVNHKYNFGSDGYTVCLCAASDCFDFFERMKGYPTPRAADRFYGRSGKSEGEHYVSGILYLRAEYRVVHLLIQCTISYQTERRPEDWMSVTENHLFFRIDPSQLIDHVQHRAIESLSATQVWGG